MGLYNLFSCNVQVQYKGCIMSKAMVFTCIINVLNLILPLIIAYRSRGFWLKTHKFFEQPIVHFTYKYILILETDDPSVPIFCSNTALYQNANVQYCSEFQINELDFNNDGKSDSIQFNFEIIIPSEHRVISLLFLPILDFQLKTICPLHMQSTALIKKDFAHSPSHVKYYGDLTFYQIEHLQCFENHIDNKFNTSLFTSTIMNIGNNGLDDIIHNYFTREATTHLYNVYTRVQYAQTSNLKISVLLRIPEIEVRYKPGVMQELKWAWPQYFSLVIIFYWIFNKIKNFVFSNRLLMVWKIDPSKEYK